MRCHTKIRKNDLEQDVNDFSLGMCEVEKSAIMLLLSVDMYECKIKKPNSPFRS